MKQKLSKFFNGLANAGVVVAILAIPAAIPAIPYAVAKLTEHTAVCDIESSRVEIVGEGIIQIKTITRYVPGHEMNRIETKNCGTLENEITNNPKTDPYLGLGRYASDYQKTLCETTPGDSVRMVLFNWPPGHTRIKKVVRVVKHDASKASPNASGPREHPEQCAAFLKKRADAEHNIPVKKGPRLKVH